MSDYQTYKESLERGFRECWERIQDARQFSADMLDSEYGKERLPVFTNENADLNVLTNPDATEEEKKRLQSLIPEKKRHKWFRSMSSSQALALSFFGNLVVHGQLDWLQGLMDDNGKPVFGTADLSAYNWSMRLEH